MSLFRDIVNESQLLTELKKSREKDVIYAINNMLRVRISYNDEKGGKGKHERYIYPVAYGLTKSGNPAIRAFQTAGSTKRGVPKWKLFRFDRIFAWSNGKRSYREYADNLKALGFNDSGDLGMTKIFTIAPIAKKNVMVAEPTQTDTSKPVTKFDVTPTSKSQNPNINKSDDYVPSSQERQATIDNDNNSFYINKNDTNSLSLDAPKTEPLMKTKPVQNTVPDSDNTTNINQLSADSTKPVTKQDITQNIEEPNTQNNTDAQKDDEFKSKVTDLMNRMNNLHKNEEDNGNN